MPPDPPPVKTAAELLKELLAAGLTGATKPDDTALMRDWLRGMGVPLPATLTDLYDTGGLLQNTLNEIAKLDAEIEAGAEDKFVHVGPLALLIPGSKTVSGSNVQNALQLRQKAYMLREQLFSYAGALFGSSGQQIVSRTLRPPTPEVARLPTPEEFLGGYEEAFATHIEGLKKNGGLTSEEATFAYDMMRNETYQKYMAKLGEFAKAGMSPFALKEISREERGIGAGTAAGAAMDKALGPGVAEPTTVTGTGEEVSEAIDKAGQGVPKEFTSVARLSPLDFLSGNLSISDIKVKYAGSPEGALKSIRGAPAGYTANPRRV